MSDAGVTASAGGPADVAQALEAFVGATRTAFGDHLESIVLYGSAAEGALRATSDVNVIVVLRAFDGERAARVREAARLVPAAVRLLAMVMLHPEVRGAPPPRPPPRSSTPSAVGTGCCGGVIHSTPWRRPARRWSLASTRCCSTSPCGCARLTSSAPR